jgi:predicted transglutaminase-like cysteine proteinase
MRRDRLGVLLAFLVILAPAAHAESFNTDFSTFPHWRYVLEHEHYTPAPAPFAGDLKSTLDRMHEKYRHIPYRTDVDVYGERNHWATRQETRRHGAADCKGVAVAEMYDLLELGVPDEDLSIIVAQVRQTGELHAVTRARDWVLDIRATRVITTEEFTQFYDPIFTINLIGWHRGM